MASSTPLNIEDIAAVLREARPFTILSEGASVRLAFANGWVLTLARDDDVLAYVDRAIQRDGNERPEWLDPTPDADTETVWRNPLDLLTIEERAALEKRIQAAV